VREALRGREEHAMANKIASLIPEENGDWHKFTVIIERSKRDGNFKLSINGEDSPRGKTFRNGS
jgi:hypothetical protein